MTSESTTRQQSVLITGATGFLGGEAVRQFLAEGYAVTAHGRNSAALQQLAVLGARTVQGDLESLARHREKVDAVVHAAALSSPWGPWPEFEKNNVTGTRHVFRYMELNNIPRMVFVSSPSLYADKGERIGMTEQQSLRRRPLSSYIRSKIAAEQLLQQAHRDGAVPELVILRPRGIIGAGDTSVAPRLLAAYRKIGVPLFGGGGNLVDLTAVENAALALRLAVQSPHADGRAYNITNGDPRPFKELLEILFEELGLPPRYRTANATLFYGLGGLLEGICKILPGSPEPPLSRYMVTTIAYSQTLDISRARTELGYRPVTSIAEALAAFAAASKASHV